ncbi:MAG: hypothetical protein ACE5IJ_04185, partial [Thermoplasmata archaeon]
GENDIVAYDIHCSNVYSRERTGYALLTSVPAGRNYFIYDLPSVPDNLFCYVESKDDANNTASTTAQAGMYVKHVVPGPNLVSVPFLQKDWSVSMVLGSARYSDSWVYDAWNNLWKQNSPFKTYADFSTVDLTMGIWVNSTIDGNLLVAGVVPDETTIQLRRGWNLIGFPSFRQDYQVADFMTDTGATEIEGFDQASPPYYLRVLASNEFMVAGEAYWVYVPATTAWTIGN